MDILCRYRCTHLRDDEVDEEVDRYGAIKKKIERTRDKQWQCQQWESRANVIADVYAIRCKNTIIIVYMCIHTYTVFLRHSLRCSVYVREVIPRETGLPAIAYHQKNSKSSAANTLYVYEHFMHKSETRVNILTAAVHPPDELG